jgi:septal ring factor EnvC (AmiA/AmiB activator)
MGLMPTTPPRRVALLLSSILVAFLVSGALAQFATPVAHADATYQQRQTDALFERLVRAQEDQAKALQEIARQIRSK